MPPSNNDTTSEIILSSDELSRVLVDPDMLFRVARTFASHPTSTATLRYYRFLSLSIDRLELDLERHRLEQQALFTRLMECETFRTKIYPTVQEYRRKARFHPYGRSPSPPSPPSFNNYVNPPPTIEVTSTPHRVDIDEEINRLGNERKDTAVVQQYGVALGVTGSKWNPIVIHDEKELKANFE
jgi:hypothetical protein